MPQSNRDAGDVDMNKRGNVFPDGKEAPSASSDNSLGDSLSSLSLSSDRMFTSPLTTYKNVLKAGVGTPQAGIKYLNQAGIKYLNLSSSSPASKELKLDDGQRLRLMRSSNNLTMDDIDDSSESDFDES